MSAQPVRLTTERTVLRRWSPADAEPFAALNADARVAAHLPAPLTAAESHALMASIETRFALHGFGLWALELPGVTPFAGFVGLNVPGFSASFTPCIEIGWRLAPEVWGFGYASEAARRVVAHAFETLRLPELVAFTVPANVRSIRLMERLGMTRDPAGDFDHPRLLDNEHLRRHVLYRLANPKL
jgi:RimJ/RimL family protein N-acetyltransferase